MREATLAREVALASLPHMGPARLRRLLTTHGSPEEAWAAVVRGEVRDPDLGGKADNRERLRAQWSRVAGRVDPTALLAEHHAAGIATITPDDERWPEAFVDDPEPPRVLFALGDVSLLADLSVAVVGTRRATSVGLALARDLGGDLTAAGVRVVSGLALGIDGASHRGVLDAGGAPVGVVATGLDVVYPPRHRRLWAEVADHGVLCSEAPLGVEAERWRFPARNRLMAALAELVVVVESGRQGGSMRTVDSAIERGTEVLAVPGAVASPVAAGPNQLLADGCPVVRDAEDVLAALGTRLPGIAADSQPTLLRDDVAASAAADPVADAIAWPPVSLEQLLDITGLDLTSVAARVTMLEAAGVIERVAEGFQRRVR